MVDSVRVIWMDGEMVAWADANVHVLTHTLHYGLGVFEGIRAYRRADGTTGVFRLEEHVSRLFASAALVGLEPAFLPDQIEAACEQLIVENDLGDAYLRPLIFVGDGAMSLDAPDNRVRTLVAGWSFSSPRRSDGPGLRVAFAQHRTRTSLTSIPRAKLCGGYAMNVFAKRAAVRAGFDEAILLDERGHACEGTGQNLFAVERGRLVTPPLSAPIIAGITRDTVMTLAREEGLVVLEEELPEDRLRLADEVFLSGTASELMPVSELSGQRVGAGGVGPITRRLYDLYLATVRGEDDAHPEWVVKV